jgi:hydrogenase nickel incorporation protein HypB
MNLMSWPGADKTSLLEKTLDTLKEEYVVANIEGDVLTSHNATRIAKKGVPVVQINTGKA